MIWSKPKQRLLLSSLVTYPVKSLKGTEHNAIHAGEMGLEGDRCYMVIRCDTNRFVTQRQIPQLSLLGAKRMSDGRVSILGCGEHEVVISELPQGNSENILSVGIWDDTVRVVDCGDKAAVFMNKFVGHESDLKGKLRVVRLPKERGIYSRHTSPKHTPICSYVNFGFSLPNTSLADGFPILLCNSASLEDLNRRLSAKGEHPIKMKKFRPNIVVHGFVPFEEDSWKVLRINGVLLHVVKPCPRCKQSTVLDSGLGFDEKNEPLNTLSEYRRGEANHKDDVYFGVNVIVQGLGGTFKAGGVCEVMV